MTALAMKHFDILEFVNKAKANGITQEFAEYTARQIDQLAETIEEQRIEIDTLKAKEPATKGDVREAELRLQKEIEVVRKEIEVVRKDIVLLKNDNLRFLVYTGIGVCVYLTGAVYTMIKLLIH